jgi:hypothetical protein
MSLRGICESSRQFLSRDFGQSLFAVSGAIICQLIEGPLFGGRGCINKRVPEGMTAHLFSAVGCLVGGRGARGRRRPIYRDSIVSASAPIGDRWDQTLFGQLPSTLCKLLHLT